MITVTTVNVNGLRAAARKGFTGWLSQSEADVVCLQEVRATVEQLDDDVRTPDGWHSAFAPASVRGRAGVAVFSRAPLEAVRIGFGSAEFDASGRYLEIDLPGLTVASLYLPSGDVGTPRQLEKERFLTEFLGYLGSLRDRCTAQGRQALVCGDWNIAHREDDLKNWRASRGRSGFLPSERAWLTKVYDTTGYVDVVRQLHPEGPGPYTWWSYLGRAFDNDSGWRIDLQVATERLAERAVKAVIERAPSYDQRWSDHAPVTVSYDIRSQRPGQTGAVAVSQDAGPGRHRDQH